ncbi:MAG: hypothetical protein AB7N91_14600 [Candidatus Tectimicrobiota bacterium]
MPLYLRHDAIRLLEASVESLHVALSSLGATRRSSPRESSSLYAPEIGLIGAAAEMAMSACLVQASGQSSLVRSSGQYKSFPQILSEFRTLVRNATPSSDFLVHDVGDANAHRQDLLTRVQAFSRLGIVRAGGLHAGRGLVLEASVLQGNEVANFLEALAKSGKMRPYLLSIPRCQFFDKDRTIIVEDLTRRLRECSGSERDVLLASVFLVLPDVPDDEPEWLSALDRVSIAPRDRDVTYLLNVLGDALPATLRRTTKSGPGIAVVVRPQDPDALPIAPQYLRRSFQERRDQLFADIANANGRLDSGTLDLPPPEAVREIFALGLESAGLLEEGHEVTAHESWPFIATSLNMSGTLGPYWFMIRNTGDLPQLRAQLQRVAKAGGASLDRKLKECQYGIQCVLDGKEIKDDDQYFKAIVQEIRQAERLRANLQSNYSRHDGQGKALPHDLISYLEDVIGGSPVGPLLEALLESHAGTEGKAYWCRILSEVAMDVDDVPALIKVFETDDCRGAHTAARKAVRRIDFRLYGPSISIGMR